MKASRDGGWTLGLVGVRQFFLWFEPIWAVSHFHLEHISLTVDTEADTQRDYVVKFTLLLSCSTELKFFSQICVWSKYHIVSNLSSLLPCDQPPRAKSNSVLIPHTLLLESLLWTLNSNLLGDLCIHEKGKYMEMIEPLSLNVLTMRTIPPSDSIGTPVVSHTLWSLGSRSEWQERR